jgi:DNA modification methylase
MTPDSPPQPSYSSPCGRVTLYLGDCLERMAEIPDGSAHCCVTSPPYFGLRDYGVDGQIGLEETPALYVERLVTVFREVRRVLRDDGTLWLNLGDSYGAANNRNDSGRQTTESSDTERDKALGFNQGTYRKLPGIKPKDLIGIPWRVAFALQADGWYLRQDIIWHKPNPMPESVKDRCTKAHEYVFLLSKSQKYYFDSEAMQEPAKYSNIKGMDGSGFKPPQNFNGKHSGGSETLPFRKTVEGSDNGTRNRRSVWTVATKPYKGAHFATYPPELIRPCIQAGCPPQGTVLDPFGGSGTTAQVAIEEGRNAIICELNPEYLSLAETRITTALNRIQQELAQGDLFLR